MKDPLIVEMDGQAWDESIQQKAISDAMSKGKDGIIFKNMQDSGWFGGEGTDDIALICDPSKITQLKGAK
jgi:hypothetical protein